MTARPLSYGGRAAAHNAHSLLTAACAARITLVNKATAMASTSTGRLYSVDEVIANMGEMMGPALDHEEWSDDEFEGYVDDSTEQQQRERETDVNAEDLDIGGECEVGGG